MIKLLSLESDFTTLSVFPRVESLINRKTNSRSIRRSKDTKITVFDSLAGTCHSRYTVIQYQQYLKILQEHNIPETGHKD